MDELKACLESLVETSGKKATELMAQDRVDDANLEKIRGNVYGIYVSVLQAAEKTAQTDEDRLLFFERNLERIPTGWRVARDAAEKRGDTVRLVQEDVKLASLGEVEDAYRRLWKEA